MARRKYLKLDTPANVKKSITRISNMLINGELEPKVANALIYGCNTALNTIRIDEDRKKLDDLMEELRLKNIL